MTENRLSSKFVFILHADIVGSTALVQKNEKVAHERFQSAFTKFSKTISDYGGKAIEIRGDALLAEFVKASDAVSAALWFQSSNTRHNLELDDDIQPELRIGIGMGEVIVADNTVTGAGVVLAQRLEQLAKPGNIVIQGAVQETIPNRLPFEFSDLGEQKIKGFNTPIKAYEVYLTPGEYCPAPEDYKNEPLAQKPLIDRRFISVVSILFLLIISAILVTLQPWRSTDNSDSKTSVPNPSTSTENIPVAELNRQSDLSLAVLPFQNLSNNADQDYFVDGVTNDLITDLSQLSGLLVIASNSVFTYKGTAVKVQEVARDLGVNFVLEGSIQRAEARIRVNAQLIDARSGHHLWADRFDRELTDIFSLQDEISQRIVSALAVELTPSDLDRLNKSTEVNAEAYDLLLRGLEFFRRFTKKTNAEARDYFKRALAIDPKFARAHANIALTIAMDLQFGWAVVEQTMVDDALMHGHESLAIDPETREVHFALCSLFTVLKRHDEALSACRESIRVDPNYADGHANLAQALIYAGEPQEVLEVMSTAKRLNPYYAFFYIWIEGHAYMLLREYPKAISKFEEVVVRNGFFLGAHLTLAAIYGNIGPQFEAEWEAAEIIALQPNFSLDKERERAPYKNSEDLEWYIQGLEAAGLPD